MIKSEFRNSKNELVDSNGTTGSSHILYIVRHVSYSQGLHTPLHKILCIAEFPIFFEFPHKGHQKSILSPE